MSDKTMDVLTQFKEYKHIFTQRADAYHHAVKACPRARDQEFQTVLDLVRFAKDDVVLDYPANGGYLSWYVPDHIRLTHVETCELFSALSYSGSPFQQQLCHDEALIQDDNSVDWILSIAGLHRVMNKQQLFKEFARSLKPGGQLVLGDASQSSPVAQFLDEWVSNHSTTGYAGSYFNEQTLAELNQAGLALLRLQEKHYHWIFPTKLDAARYCKQVFGVDMATDQEVLTALEHYLGFDPMARGVGLKWQSRLISCIKPLISLG